ncbi:MAG: serine/threonine protein kinase, partial [Planctomycetes bacterium]|nr:serine/threonine protein kinase [Planctomycetota bacterium]
MEIGPYTIERELGRGGMGAVYLGRVRGDPDAVAIKVIHASLADDPDLLARFEREGQVLERLAHPNLVALRARGTYSGGLWLAMDYVEGESLEERLKRGPLSSPAARQLLISLCEGITSAHAGGVLHRDLKPANVLLRVPDAHPLIVDFGIALPLDVSQHLTQTGEILGSPGYLAPEQCGLGASPSSETDVYGLGAVLYAALTGEAPIQGPTLLGTLDKVLHAPPRPPRELVPGVDPALERVCLRCLAKEPQERYSDSSELARALREEHAPAR